MKKIIIIGKLNEMINELNQELSKKFQVQLCSEQLEMVRSMMKIVHPDMVIVSLIGLYDINERIFFYLSQNHASTPVLTIGTESECSDYLRYYEKQQFQNLIRPVKSADVCKKCQEILNVSDETVRRHILVVDDDPVTLRSMKSMLEKYYSVAIAPSGTKAMAMLGKKRPDLILLDYEMPVCDGRMTLEMIKQEEEFADIPVIFLTGVTDKKHIQAVLQLKPANYLLKPPVEEKILHAIRQVLPD